VWHRVEVCSPDAYAALTELTSELVLRAPRDAELARVFRQTDTYWYRTLRDLINLCIAEGAIDPDVNADGVARLAIGAIKGLSLPTVAGFQPKVANQVFRELERVLGFSPTLRNFVYTHKRELT
jgi:hypothetical protein